MQQDEVSFGRFRLDLRHRKLTGEGAPIELKSKAFDILAVLASAQGQVVTKDELMAKAWPGLVVEESNIQVHISALRRHWAKDETGQSISSLCPAAATGSSARNRPLRRSRARQVAQSRQHFPIVPQSPSCRSRI